MKNRNRVQAQIPMTKPAYSAWLAGNLQQEVSSQVVPAMSRTAAERNRRIFGEVTLADAVETETGVTLTFIADTEPA